MKKYNAFQLKVFMAMLMVLDHINMIPGFITGELSLFFHIITRCVAVWFAYMAVEGFIYTRNKIKYNIRLFIWAFIMLAGNSILSNLYADKNIYIVNNIFLTLAFGVLSLNIISSLKNNNTVIRVLKVISLIIVLLFGCIFTEGGLIILPFILITYLLRNRTKIRNLSYVILSLLFLIMSYEPYETVSMTIKMMMYNSDWLFITVIPFIYIYNGKRGLNNKFSKYFFYVFYPAHLWIIATIAYFVK